MAQIVRTRTFVPPCSQGYITCTFAEAGRIPVRSYSTPAAGERPPRGNVTTATESGKCRVHRSLHVNTPQPFTLKSLSLVGVEHGVVAVSVIREDGVVAPQHRTSLLQVAA